MTSVWDLVELMAGCLIANILVEQGGELVEDGDMVGSERAPVKGRWVVDDQDGDGDQGKQRIGKRAGVVHRVARAAMMVEWRCYDYGGGSTFALIPIDARRAREVGPGEVDDELEDEVASECAKYGTVTRVLIFEITEPNFPADEAVRIFVQFERPEETTKALIDLEGRFFGGRVVHASFYDVERFGKNELAPVPGEIPGYP
ncbi:putative DNA-damage-repair/toleration protein DRT111, chloroplastic [Cocos nucifera]|uniref:Putative DNA-damage-repair/toleration protein DRT111, chloroplastic n=1 Tax=Cocos nucifera TaxID=13894 RepID=A0A8K0IR19_COCNU|nr:putative DNA-damage-repair/toleration protein DRT111, chloroplastic [Cocos nucifera]